MRFTTVPPGARRLTLAVFLAAILAAAVAAQNAAVSPAKEAQADNDYQIGAVLWTQSAAEARALRYQAFAFARLLFDRDLRVNRRLRRKRAIVVDVDETVLDNSAYQAELIFKRQPYTEASWTEWCDRAEAIAIPGAVDFLRHAASRGARIFYVTNRRQNVKEATIRNLKQKGFPDVGEQTVLVRTDASTKEPRRRQISERYRIVLLMGDNLADFSDIFEGKTTEARAAAVDETRGKFGAQFVMLPNPMYGDWESAVYGYDFKLSEEEKAARRKAALKSQ
jgi:5'-nucleotidase (lipoprotein e(P4) family)